MMFGFRDLYSQVLASYKQKLIKQEPGEEYNEADLDICCPVDEEGDLFFVFSNRELHDRLNDSDVVVMGDEECHMFDISVKDISIVEVD